MMSSNSMPSGFHDTSLVSATQNGSTISLSVEYYTEDDVEASVRALIHGVEKIFRDDVPIPEFKMETDYASIVVLEQEDQDVVLLLKWINFQAKTDTTCFYRLAGADISLQTEYIKVPE